MILSKLIPPYHLNFKSVPTESICSNCMGDTCHTTLPKQWIRMREQRAYFEVSFLPECINKALPSWISSAASVKVTVSCVIVIYTTTFTAQDLSTVSLNK